MVAAEKAGNPGDLNMASTLPDSEIISLKSQMKFTSCSLSQLTERNEEDFWEMLIFFYRGRWWWWSGAHAHRGLGTLTRG